MNQRLIVVQLRSLAQFLNFGKSDFPDIRSFNLYKKDQIYIHRNLFLSDFFNQKITNDDFQQSEFGKPYLKEFPKFNFNHSHSQKNYALAMSDCFHDLGIDVEDLDRKVRFEALAKHAFHPEELKLWNDLGQDSKFWFKVWTTKEAVLKASGLGIRLNLNELNTLVHPQQDGGICEHPELGVFAYQNFELPHVMITVAWRSERSCKGFQFPQIQIFQN
jgi:4'-phosphopantetheinyl transferase